MRHPTDMLARAAALLCGALVASPVMAQTMDTSTLPAIAVVRPDPDRLALARETLREALAAPTRPAPEPLPAPQPAGPATRDTIRGITVERAGQRTLVRLSGNGRARAVISEPLHGDGHTRLMLSLGSATLAASAVQPHLDSQAALSRVVAEQRDTTVRVIIDADAIGAYQVDSDDSGFTLSFGPAIATPLAIPAAAPAPALPAIDAAASDRTGTPTPNDVATWIVVREAIVTAAERAAPAFVASANWIRDAMGRVAETLATSGATRGSVLVVALLLFVPIVVWKLAPMRTASTAPTIATPADHGADARIWAARTLADQGLDIAAISGRTGLARDAAALVVRASRAAKAAAPGTNFRSL